jgi:uncharacterized membrane protein (UPF0127 family)
MQSEKPVDGRSDLMQFNRLQNRCAIPGIFTCFRVTFLQFQKSMNRIASTFLTLALPSILLAPVTAFSQQAAPLPVVTLTAGMHVIRAEVAATDEARQQGLMFRASMGANEGMLFVFPAPAQVCMWMKNTPLPLSVAFLDEQGKIVNIEDMAPHTLDSHCSEGQVRYALEMNQGWFGKKNVKPGSRIAGLPPVR